MHYISIIYCTDHTLILIKRLRRLVLMNIKCSLGHTEVEPNICVVSLKEKGNNETVFLL